MTRVLTATNLKDSTAATILQDCHAAKYPTGLRTMIEACDRSDPVHSYSARRARLG